MPVNKFALIRYKTIDQCLQNRMRRWTLEDLMEACSEALFEYEGIAKGVSKRTVQLDIQTMRSDKIGYNAPIEVIDKKYYRYAEKSFSITNIPITGSDLETLQHSVDMLKQFKGFSHFKEVDEIIARLEEKVMRSDRKSQSIIYFESNEQLKGIEFLNPLFEHISKKHVLAVAYQSFKANKPNDIVIHPYFLKEYRNRWFLVGVNEREEIMHLALDRIVGLAIKPDVKYKKNTFIQPNTFYNNIIGITKNSGEREVKVVFRVNANNAPYIRTKPLHSTQQEIEIKEDGSSVFSIDVAINLELEKELLAFGPTLQVLGPRRLRQRFRKLAYTMNTLYEQSSSHQES